MTGIFGVGGWVGWLAEVLLFAAVVEEEMDFVGLGGVDEVIAKGVNVDVDVDGLSTMDGLRLWVISLVVLLLLLLVLLLILLLLMVLVLPETTLNNLPMPPPLLLTVGAVLATVEVDELEVSLMVDPRRTEEEREGAAGCVVLVDADRISISPNNKPFHLSSKSLSKPSTSDR
jgi:hypothetical protein